MNHFEFRKPDSKEFDYIKHLVEELNLDNRNLKEDQFTIGRYDGHFAGFARLIHHPDCVEISSLGVLPEYRKKGLAAELVHHLLKESEADNVYLVTALPEYFEKMGFKATKEVPKSIKGKIMDCRERCHEDEDITAMVI